MSTLFASFDTLDQAQKAVGALLDHGAKPEDISLVANEPIDSWRAPKAATETSAAESEAKKSITTTTAGDAVIGAEKGALIGVGVGIIAAIAALAVPGVGLVVGGGALAAAIAAAAGTTAAGAVAGGITGYLEDQGMGPETITRYSTVFERGGTILGIGVPSGRLLPEYAEQLLAKYGAADVAVSNSTRSLMDRDNSQRQLPLIENPNLDQIQNLPPSVPVEAGQHAYGVANIDSIEAMEQARASADVVYVPTEIVNRATIRPILVDPVTGKVERAVLADPLTGFEHPIQYHDGVPVYLDPAISQHPVANRESDTVMFEDDPTRPTVTVTGSERVSIL
jgi:hypothetical protein